MNFTSYVVLSTLVVIGVVAHAYVAHEQFYPAVVYLSTDKMCLAVMYNFAFALFLLFGKVLLRIFIGTLRDLEVEQLVDSGRGFLADTILFLVFYAPTIDNREVGTVYLIQYICCVIFMKVFHLTTQIRVSHMFEVGVPRLIVNIKLVALMVLLLCCDLIALQYFYSVASRSSTFFTWILFEALTMSTVVLVSICKYSVHMMDLRLDNGWPGKSVCLFYVDLVHDVVSMTLFLVFMLTFFVQNPSRLPIYMMADVIQVARKLAQRLRSFRRYRRISLNMEIRFPDATDEEIEHNEHCVICRDSLFEASKPKKLPCNHIFHIDCLRSWLVMQQVCPTCRAEIPAETPSSFATAPQAPAPTQPPAAAPTAGGPASSNASATAAATNLPGSAAVASTQPATPAVSSTPASTPSAAVAASSLASSSVPAPLPQPAAPGAAVRQPAAPTVPQAREAETAGVQVLNQPLGTLGTLPPAQEIMDSLKRAEEVAKFLRQQTEFWMDQVRLIEQNHSQSASSGGLTAAPPQWSVLSAPGVPQSIGAALAGVAGAAGLATAPPGFAESFDDSSPASPSSFGLRQRRSNACEGDRDVAADEGGATADADNGSSSTNVCDQMAELRRKQKEQWERKRTASSTSLGAA